jgi:hypothetical protein
MFLVCPMALLLGICSGWQIPRAYPENKIAAPCAGAHRHAIGRQVVEQGDGIAAKPTAINLMEGVQAARLLA